MENESRCEKCRFYAAFAAPYHYDLRGYPDGVTVYGCCFKHADRDFASYPVYLPDGGVCKDYKRKIGVRETREPQYEQISIKEA